MVAVKEKESCCDKSLILVGLGLSVMLAVIVIECSTVVQLQMMKADVTFLKEQMQHQQQTACEQVFQASSKANYVNHHDAVSGDQNRAKRSTARHGRTRRTRASHDRNGGGRRKQIRLVAEQNLYHPSAHMTRIADINSYANRSDGRLRWTPHGGSHTLSHNNLFHFDSYDELEIQSSGTYFVYLQITYNGRTEPNVVRYPTCSHKLLAKLKNGQDTDDTIPLLHTSTTQYRLGRQLWERPDGVRMAAFDSSFTAGVFHLESGDRLSVQPDNHGATCSVISHHDQTFLGAIRLQMSGLPSVDHP